MKKYTYSNENIYTGFIDTDEEIPNYTYVEPESSDHTLWDSTSWVIPPAPSVSLEQYKLINIQAVRDYFDEIVETIKSDSAKFEPGDTWEVQRTEWLRYNDDITAKTPYCDALAYTRGIDKAILMDKIGGNVVGYAGIQGQLHSLEDIINNAPNEATVDAIMQQL